MQQLPRHPRQHCAHVPAPTVARAGGWVSTAYLPALAVTIPVTSWAVDRFGARRLWLSGLVLFLVNLPVGAVAFWLALLGPGFAAAILALAQAAEHASVTAWQAPAPLGGGAALLAGYAVRAFTARRTPPLIDLRLFGSRGFSASVTVMGLVGLATFASLFALPLYHQQVREHGAFAARALAVPLGIGAALAMPLAGRLSDRVGSRTLAQGGSVLCMLNQLGASVGIAVVALIVQTAGDDVMGGVFGFACGAVVTVLAVSFLLPGRSPEVPGSLVPRESEVEAGAR
ncbi:hypothetical protein ACSNOI_33835 [Actinomadura kijaniata]|uniref:hypothetical protein n=1 Tax=Actinomadura kijaniata TaxID=46161 RepID=UPI003F1C72AC